MIIVWSLLYRRGGGMGRRLLLKPKVCRCLLTPHLCFKYSLTLQGKSLQIQFNILGRIDWHLFDIWFAPSITVGDFPSDQVLGFIAGWLADGEVPATPPGAWPTKILYLWVSKKHPASTWAESVSWAPAAQKAQAACAGGVAWRACLGVGFTAGSIRAY